MTWGPPAAVMVGSLGSQLQLMALHPGTVAVIASTTAMSQEPGYARTHAHSAYTIHMHMHNTVLNSDMHQTSVSGVQSCTVLIDTNGLEHFCLEGCYKR